MADLKMKGVTLALANVQVGDDLYCNVHCPVAIQYNLFYLQLSYFRETTLK